MLVSRPLFGFFIVSCGFLIAVGRILFHLDLLQPNLKPSRFDKYTGSAQRPRSLRGTHSPRSESLTEANPPPAAARTWQMEHLARTGSVLKDDAVMLGPTELATGKASSSAPRELQLSSVLPSLLDVVSLLRSRAG
ncbi:hypothetical protein P7K49_013039 [Saguinus oedipus]|uniref:Uncharacterized protein n=1 Tax=Saguinus oedipus TaxID=9490 RepID=A0ABQ9VG56_SAGOE|nr:hypothetical protein P7K49_013039 [Saguinus oedipus]